MFDYKFLNNKFNRSYLTAITISSWGNGMHFIALTWLIYNLTNSISMISYLIGLSFIARIITSSFIGIYVDKYNKYKITILSDGLRFLATLMIAISPFIFSNNQLIKSIFIFEFINGALSPLFTVATAGLIKELSHQKSLTLIYKAKELCMQVALILGSATGGIIIAFASPYIVILINAITYLISALLINSIKIIKKSNFANEIILNSKTPISIDINKYLTKNLTIIYLITLSAVIAVPALVFDNILADLTKNILHSNEIVYGLLDSSYAIGAIFAMCGINLFILTTGKALIVHIYLLIIGVLNVSLGFIDHYLGALIITVFLGYAGIKLKIIIQIAIQNETSIDWVGRIQSLALCIQNIFAFITLFLISLSSGIVSSNYLLMITGILTIGFSLSLALLLRKIQIKELSHE